MWATSVLATGPACSAVAVQLYRFFKAAANSNVSAEEDRHRRESVTCLLLLEIE